MTRFLPTHLTYDRSTRVLVATGNARIFSTSKVYRGDMLTYNLDTKAITSSVFRGEEYPKLIAAQHVTTPEFNHYRLTNASFHHQQPAEPELPPPGEHGRVSPE